MMGLLFKTRQKGVEEAEREAIRPIVEFFKLNPSDSKQGARLDIFRQKTTTEKTIHTSEACAKN